MCCVSRPVDLLCIPSGDLCVVAVDNSLESVSYRSLKFVQVGGRDFVAGCIVSQLVRVPSGAVVTLGPVVEKPNANEQRAREKVSSSHKLRRSRLHGAPPGLEILVSVTTPRVLRPLLLGCARDYDV